MLWKLRGRVFLRLLLVVLPRPGDLSWIDFGGMYHI